MSRDQFQDNYRITTEYHEVIEKRLIIPTFIGDILKLPDDPLARPGYRGPPLEEFLRF